MKSFLLVCSILLIFSATASAGNTGNISTGYSTSGTTKFVTFTVTLTSDSHASAPGASVMFSDCRAGLGLPVGPEPSWSQHNAGNLQVNKIGNVQWDVNRLPPVGSKPLIAQLRFAIPRHSLPYSVCLRESGVQFSTGYRWSSNMRFFLKPRV